MENLQNLINERINKKGSKKLTDTEKKSIQNIYTKVENGSMSMEQALRILGIKTTN